MPEFVKWEMLDCCTCDIEVIAIRVMTLTRESKEVTRLLTTYKARLVFVFVLMEMNDQRENYPRNSAMST